MNRSVLALSFLIATVSAAQAHVAMLLKMARAIRIGWPLARRLRRWPWPLCYSAVPANCGLPRNNQPRKKLPWLRKLA